MGKSKTFGDHSGKKDVYNYDNHASIITRKQHMDKSKVFSFRDVGKKEISSVIQTLNCKKAPLSNDMRVC